MIRRLVRAVLWLGLLVGVFVAIQRLRESRRLGPPSLEGDGGTTPWPRLAVDTPAAPVTTRIEAPVKDEAPDAAPAFKDEAPAVKDEAPAVTAEATWVDPEEGGACPLTYPVKASVSRGIFHVPGGASYGRMQPERCYRTPEDAVADGLRQATR
jgi:hypothetical protein